MEPETEIMSSSIMISNAISLLPYDGDAIYLPPHSCALPQLQWMKILSQSIDWSHDTVKMFGKTLILKRKSAWYGDPGASYAYGGIRREPLQWTHDLLLLKTICESISESSFNSVLCNYYHDGQDGMGWHSDNEPELGEEPIIASVSFGADRIFAFKHRITKERITIQLEDASMLIMRGQSQSAWKHALPKTTKVQSPRINVTFRNILM
jgi:alkylated DNA repair dioxygenase AlkB